MRSKSAAVGPVLVEAAYDAWIVSGKNAAVAVNIKASRRDSAAKRVVDECETDWGRCGDDDEMTEKADTLAINVMTTNAAEGKK